MTQDEARELLQGEFDLDIPNFKKWNPDTRSRRSWFALSVDWFRDPKISKLTDAEQAFWLKLLSHRATAGGPITGCNYSWIIAHVGCRCSSPTARLIKLWKLQLIELRTCALQDRQDRQDRQKLVDVNKERSNERVIAELKNIDDDFFSSISVQAQKSWLGIFGVEKLRRWVPTYHSVWLSEQPKDKWGKLRPLTFYVRNCLEKQINHTDQNPRGPTTVEEIMAALREGD